jgi:alpha-galactosidase
MRRIILTALTVLFIGVQTAGAQGEPAARQLAPTPPMGWNSWQPYGATITGAEYKANAEWLAKNLKPYGWEYAVIDGGWYFAQPSWARPPWRNTMDGFGRNLPAPNRFPSSAGDAGFKPLADFVHSLGLKFGIHMMRGIPRLAVEKNLPIADSSFHAAEAANTSETCSWDGENYGVKDNAAGQAYYDSVLKLYAGWGIDFLKVDCIASRPFQASELRMISRAIHKAGRPIVLSLSPGPASLANAAELEKYAEMWRISDDFWDNWTASGNESWSQDLHGQFATAVGWAPYIGPGHWPDADMLPLGYVGPRPGLGKARWTRFTHDEQRTLMTLWCIMRSPLILGSDLTRNDAWTTSLETNREVLAVDQASTDNRPLITSNTVTIWTAKPQTGAGRYLAIFNRSDEPLQIDLRWNELGLVTGAPYDMRDLWEKKDAGVKSSLALTLRPHACALYLAVPKP